MSNNESFSKQNPELDMEESFHLERGDIRDKSSGFIILSTFFTTIINWLTAPFVLTEEEKRKAGIYIGRMGKDE